MQSVQYLSQLSAHKRGGDMAPPDTRGARRRLTTAGIERAALRQAVESGSAAVTVESICSEALISPRTFYNYFPTRDAVLAGQQRSTIPSGVAERSHG